MKIKNKLNSVRRMREKGNPAWVYFKPKEIKEITKPILLNTNVFEVIKEKPKVKKRIKSNRRKK